MEDSDGGSEPPRCDECLRPPSPGGQFSAVVDSPQYTSSHLTGSLAWLGIEDSPSYVGEPSCNGCAERFIRTLKEQVIWTKRWATIGELEAAVRSFVALYNHEWLIERHGHRTPREAYLAATGASCGMMSKVNDVSKEPGPVQVGVFGVPGQEVEAGGDV